MSMEATSSSNFGTREVSFMVAVVAILAVFEVGDGANCDREEQNCFF